MYLLFNVLMDLHNGIVCGSSSSAERYSVDESEEEQSGPLTMMAIKN